VDRGASIVFRGFFSVVAIVMAIWMLIGNVGSYAELAALGAIPVGVLAGARALWKSSTRATRDRTAALMDAMREALPGEDHAEAQPASDV
jgi:hypothetical protein